MTGAELRQLREDIGLTQAELGERLGVPANTIHRWEIGALKLRHSELIRLAMLRLKEHPEQPPPRTWDSARVK